MLGEKLYSTLNKGVNWDEINHITKVDPEKGLNYEDQQYLKGTDAAMIGGSDGVTEQNTYEAIEILEELDIPVYQEPYNSDQVTGRTIQKTEGLAVPSVLNGDQEHIIGKHIDFYSQMPEIKDLAREKGQEKLREKVPKSLQRFVPQKVEEVAADFGESAIENAVFSEAYIIQNPDSKAAQLASAYEPMTTEEIEGTSHTLNNYFDSFDAMYIEYSGTFGDAQEVEIAAEALDDDTLLLYGGGIDSLEKTETMLEAGADAVVVGDFFHEEPEEFQNTIPDAL